VVAGISMQLDPRTLLAIVAFLLLLNAGIGVGICWLRRDYSWLMRWIAGDVLFGLALLLLMLRGYVPDWMSVSVANLAIIIASILYLEGARSFRGLKAGVPLVYTAAGLTILATTYFQYFVPSMNARISLISLFMGAIFLLCFVVLKDRRQGWAPCAAITSGFCALSAALLVCRAAYFCIVPSVSSLSVGGVDGLLAAGVLLAITGCSAGFLLLTDERSIAELKEAEVRQIRANDELGKALRVSESLRERLAKNDAAKSEFVAMMTHEIRNPLSAMMATAELLMETELTAEQREYAESLDHSAKGLVTLTDEALDLSRIEAGHLIIESYPFHLHTAVETVMHQFTPVARVKGLDLVLESSGNGPRRLIGDASRIRQVITNLVGNALKFTSAGHVRVNAVCERMDSKTVTVKVIVSDTGIGIPRDKIESLFEKLVMPGKSVSGGHKGAGMGLVISKKLIELMGGRIYMESEPGKGSKFWFELPLPIAHEDRNVAGDESGAP
jgi:signal transduction histidine kinase